MQKTNAARLLDQLGVPYVIRQFPYGEQHIDAVQVAKLLAVEPERVFKTIVCSNTSEELLVFCIPAPSDLDLKKAADAAEAKRVRLIRVGDLERYTGYVRGGCSPIGMKKHVPTFIEESAQMFDTILVSAGERGTQLDISPFDLQISVSARFADLV